MRSFNKIISSWSKKKAIFIWAIMNFIVIAMMDLALFGQTTGKLKDASWHKKLFPGRRLQAYRFVSACRVGRRCP